jgi:6-phosphogluconolactonase
VNENGHPVLVTPSLGDTQAATCWLVVPGNGQFAYVANAGSGTISSYAVSQGGSLALLNAAAASTNAPLDMGLSHNSRFLYVRNGGGTVSGFRLHADGSLAPVTIATGVPGGAQGLAAR